VIRFEEDFRKDIDNVRYLYIPLPDGRQIPLEEVAEVSMKTGTAQVSREDAKRRITVSFNVRNRDVQSIISDIRTIVSKDLKLPPGYYITYGGQFENLVAAQNRLAIAVPVALLLIFVLLYFTFNSVRQTMLISSALPLAAVGGVFALYLRGMNFSISAGVGFIALFGVAVLNGIVLIAEFNRLERDEGITDIYERTLKGLRNRLRPVIMTAAVASLGFLPMAISTSAGAEVQKPLATVVIGGLITATILTLIVLPVLYILFSPKSRKEKTGKTSANGVMPLLALFLLLVPVTLFSQEGPAKIYTLQQAIGQALQANGIVLAAGMEVENQKVLRKSAWDIDKTHAGFSYGQFNSAAQDNQFTVSQGFAFPLTYIKQGQAATTAMEGAEHLSQMTRNDVIAEVRSAWYLLSFYHSRLTLLNYEDSLFSNFLNAATLRYKKGETNLLERMNAESQLLAIRNQVQQAKADIHIQECRLQTLLDEPMDISITDTVLQKLPLSVPVEEFVIAGNPELAYLDSRLRLARFGKQVESSKLIPDLDIGYFNQSNKDISPSARYGGIEAGISIPLFFGAQKGKIESARLNEKIAATNLSYQQNAMKHRLHILAQENRKYKESLDFYEMAALSQADQIIRQANLSYHSGAIDYLEFVENLKQGIEIRNNYLETLSAYNQSVIAIDHLIYNQ
jgi:heavy metal efflux system protein